MASPSGSPSGSASSFPSGAPSGTNARGPDPGLAPQPTDGLRPRSAEDLRERQRRGDLRVRLAADFRRLAAEDGLAEAYGCTDVVVAADAGFTDQASLVLHLGPTDPPIRMRDPQLDGVTALAAGSAGDLVLPIGGASEAGHGGAQVLASLLAGRSIELSSGGEGTPLQPRRELHTRLDLRRIGGGRLLLHRGIVENGLVALSSAEGVLRTGWGPLLGPFAQALYTCGGADSIGLAMPGLSLLGPGSPVLVGGAIGWVMGSGSAHQPRPKRLPTGHARTPGAVAALSVDLHDLDPRWLRAAHFEGHGGALLVVVAAPIPLLHGGIAAQVATPDSALEAPVLDVSIPRRIKPSFGGVSYAALKAGTIEVDGRRIPAVPSHSPRLAAEGARALIDRLLNDRFPLHPPALPLPSRPALIPLDS
jgi:uncharacterized protein (DUF39 family)